MLREARPQPACSTRFFGATAACVCLLLGSADARAEPLRWQRHSGQGGAAEQGESVRTVAFTAPRSEDRTAARAPVEPVRRPAKQPTQTTNAPAPRRPAPPQVQQAGPAIADSSTEAAVQHGEVVFASGPVDDGRVEPVDHHAACHCGDPACGLPEPGCAVLDPGCAIEPGCGCEPGCAVIEPGCECVDGCGCGEVACGGACGCGDVVTRRRFWLGSRCLSRGAVPICIYLPPLKALNVSAGVQGFKNPLDGFRDRGNFGFNQSINVGGKMAWLPIHGLGYQLGFRTTQNQLSGTQFDPAAGLGLGTADSHSQEFFTGGVFVRNPHGWQGGVVYDLLDDERLASVQFGQIRGQLSVTNPKGHEVGFLFTSSTDDQIITTVDPTGQTIGNFLFEAADQYLGFYRFTACGGGEMRLLAGADGEGRGILGADLLAPLNHYWSINTGFRYFIADESAAGIGSTEEAWNLGINLLYHFRGTARKWHTNPFRPLFDVADNGSLSVDLIN